MSAAARAPCPPRVRPSPSAAGGARAAFPEAAEPCVYLSHALLQEGVDWDAAEEALRAVLRLDPDDRTARRNLEILLRHAAGRPSRLGSR